MSLSRHGTGPIADLGALASQVHPVFMLPPIAASVFGGLLAGEVAVWLAALHGLTVFFGLYTAHVKDGYVDFYGRGEDDDHPLTEWGCRLTLAGASLGFFACLGVLWWAVGVGAVLVSLPGWLIGFHHAPQLDTNPVTATTGYPLGIAFALVGGYYVQATGLSPTVVALAAVFLIVLSGIKIVDDATDHEYDRSIGKRTVAVAVGPRRARRVAFGLMVAGMVGVVGLAATLSGIPPSAGLATVAFAGVALLARDADPELATKLLIRGSYLFLAVLVAAVWFRPLV